mmetsp:Transcript_14255/g.28772  ORF Transcript_14255/g.28772 Transcript_14255/m.28772 type:complete len:123 (-) Transcript_14255:87-455(-)
MDFRSLVMLMQRVMGATVLAMACADYFGVLSNWRSQGVIALVTLLTMALPHWTLLCAVVDVVFLPIGYWRAIMGIPYTWLAGVCVALAAPTFLMQAIKLWLEEVGHYKEDESKGEAQEKKKQ